MARRNEDVTKVDPMFYIPEGVYQLEYTDEDADVDFSEYEEVDDDSDEVFDTEDDEDDEPYLPDIIGIEQVIRTNATGNQVVDVIVEVEDTETQYDFRVVKL